MTVIYCDCCGNAIHEIYSKPHKSEMYDYDLCTDCKDIERHAIEDLRIEYLDVLRRRKIRESPEGMQV